MHRTLVLALAALLLCACRPAESRQAGTDARAADRPPAPRMAEVDVIRPARAPEPGAFALRPVDERWVEETLRSLPLREKVGQMVLTWTGGGYPGADAPEMRRLNGLAERGDVGGVIISIGSPRDYVAKLNAMQRRAKVPLLMVTDMESGPGMRLTGSATEFPPVMGLAATGSEALAEQVGKVIAAEGRAVGIGLNLAPVLDVNSNPRNPIINTRSFGEDPAEVARFGAAYVRGLHQGGILAAGKHFPGHGDTHTDSHIDLPRVDADRATLDSVDLPPFRAAVQAGIDGILVGHIAVPKVTGDDRLSSLSPKVTGDILRRQLGFDGLVFTDAMNMGALTRRYDEREAAVLAIEAGADLLLQPDDIAGTIAAVTRAVQSGRLAEARIDESVRRILSAKSRLGLPQRATVDAERVGQVVGRAEHRRLAEEVAARSITLARDARGLVPLASGVKRILAITYADGRSSGGAFTSALGGGGRTVETARVNASTPQATYARLRARAANADAIVVSAYVTPREYRGSVETGGGFAAFVEGLARDGKPVVAVSFGSPYLVNGFPSVPAYLLAWGRDPVSQVAAARALLGQAPISGRLPVTLPGAPRGSGVTRNAAPAGAR